MSGGSTTLPFPKRAPALAWALLVLVVMVGLGSKLYWDIDFLRYKRQVENDKQQFVKDGLVMEREMKQRLAELKGVEMTRVEEAFGITPPLERRPVTGLAEGLEAYWATWLEPTCRVYVTFHIDAPDTLSTYTVVWNENFYRPPDYTVPSAEVWAQDLGRRLCPTLKGIFTPLPYLFWLPLLFLYWIKPNYRGWSSLVLAACGLLVPLIWLMASFSLLEISGVTSYDPNLWGLLMFVITAAALAIGGISNRVTDPEACKKCGYCLHGVAGNRCPECGRVIPLAQRELLH